MVVSVSISVARLQSTYGVRRVVANVDGLALEEVGHEDLVLVLLVTGSQNIGTLDSLVLETEDVVDDQESLLRIAGASDIGLHAIDSGISTLGIIALANDGRHGTASVRLSHCVYFSGY
jgi:hypothetical protein